MRNRVRSTSLFLLVFVTLALVAPPAHAGGGPATVLVVVNADSPVSLRVANHYVKLRSIPPSHVCPLHGVPNLTVIDVNTFREHIWKGIDTYIKEHGLTEEIDTIAYSADFPFGVNYDPDFKGVTLPQPSNRARVASLTSMTYLIQPVLEKSREYLDVKTNEYFRETSDGNLPSQGFRHRYGWTHGEAEPDRKPEDPETTNRYYLSTMLGFTGMQGNTVPEVLTCLDRAAACDGTQPKGTVYLMVNKNVRATTRMNQFDDVVAALKKRHRKGVILKAGEDGQDGKVPIGKKDVMGLMAGIAGFKWPDEKSRMLPGAIAEHLTSFGARFDGSGQTKISAFLRAGAAGSSGAVAEPYALWPKFPRARMHVYYADGCSLAESFYQSLYGPFQLLIVGDPLARPYARFAKVALKLPKGPLQGDVGVAFDLAMPKGRDVRTVEVWVDGQIVTEQASREPPVLDTTRLADGEHELRLVVVDDSTVETRSWAAARLTVANGTNVVTIKGPRKSVGYGDEVKFSGKSAKAKDVVLLAGQRVVATAKHTSSLWHATVDTRVVGIGTVRLQARATWADGTVVLSPFFDLEVGEAGGGKKPKRHHHKTRRTKKHGKKTAKPSPKSGGLLATVVDAKGKEHTFTATTLNGQGKKRFLTELRKAVKGKPKSIRLSGSFEVAEAGIFRFAMNAAGHLALKVDGAVVFAGDALVMDRQAYAGLRMKAGWHPIEVTYEPTGSGDLSVWFGGDVVTAPLQGKMLRR